MVQFTKLRLSGFKSFVDHTDLEIGPGLNGVIGPNGCGKSNLVEALRWAMGENSPKRMRSSEMNDVIFNGTTNRPARNMAEVTLYLDNTDRTAPAEINDSDTLEVSRKIERDMGSTYRVNGKVVRLRDVQLLFADSSIGAHSPALVSQGRVSDIINAKPVQRRQILEEAAGVSGLHVRRHEAELKLRAAETNLTRVDDVLSQMNGQLDALKKQARQASRYRNLSDHIQKAEATSLYLRRNVAMTAVDAAKAALDKAENLVREKTLTVTELTTVQTGESAKLPDLRKKESEQAAALQRLRLAHSSLEAEERKITEEQERTRQILTQVVSDIEHEARQKAEAAQTVETHRFEIAEIVENEAAHETTLADLRDKTAQTEAVVSELDGELTQSTEKAAGDDAHRRTLERQKQTLEHRLEQITRRIDAITRERDELTEASGIIAEIAEIEPQITAADETVALARTDLESREVAKAQAESAFGAAQENQRAADRAHNALTAERDAIARLLRQQDDSEFSPIIDTLNVNGGFEKALAVALGDDLWAALDSGAPTFWRNIPEDAHNVLPALPGEAEPLSKFVKAPPELARALSQIGVVETAEQAESLIYKLFPGQCIVTHEGGAWRWDGFTIRPEATPASAIRLEQKNRVADLTVSIADSAQTLSVTQTALDDARQSRSTAESAVAKARLALKMAEQNLGELRDRHGRLTREATSVTNKLSNLSATLEAQNEEKSSVEGALTTANAEIGELPDGTALRTRIDEIRVSLNEQRGILSEQRGNLGQLTRDTETRKRRKGELEHNIESWLQRVSRNEARIDELTERRIQEEQTLDRLAHRPDEIAREKQSLLDFISEADKTRSEAAHLLAAAENLVAEVGRNLKDAEAELADEREARAHAQAAVTAAETALSGIEQQIQEKFSSTIAEALAKFEINPETDEMPDIETIATKLERLVRERENMGPVNLVAEAEAEQLGTEMTKMQTERNDLVEAIERLRQGISKLNREARERLTTAFDVVNTKFQDLFTRLFTGGKAHLQLIEAEDPLEAGLEIFAQPPGKKLQVLSLLSGGEQTLTSIALIFAMFLTNPSPICVLDEIDAPLDESNVDRVCSLLEDLVNMTSTRFIVITHHRMTMARMDRLYGVTMSEKGISQLVSVDLRQQDLNLEVAA